jgi:NADH dehydrogenase (ubiquinone) flavoprotein 1
VIIGPEVEKRIDNYRAANGPVLFGGRLMSDADADLGLALPDNLGGHLQEEKKTIA